MAEVNQPSQDVIQQVCATLRQWSMEGPPRNPRRTAGELAVSLEAALGPPQETSLKDDEVQTEPEKNEAGELRRLLGELRLEYEDLSTETRQRAEELTAAVDAKAELQVKLLELTEREAKLRADCDAQRATSETDQEEVCHLRRRVAALSAHLSSVLAPVSAACRTRPLSSYKEAEVGTRALTVDGPEITVEDALGRSRKFKIDRVLDDAKQEDLFLAAAPWVEHTALGGSSCVFAYGATGSGKTHSILGAGDERSPGLAHHAIRRLIEGQNCGEVKISMLEVYCEQIRDLLAVSSEGGAQPTLGCSRRDGQGRMMLDYVEALAGASDVNSLLARGFANRATEGTLCNDSSSRSHVVLTVKAVEPARGRLVLVDLAGSENVQRSGADEDAKLLAEAKAINRSLSALADVVEATAKQQSFVPYRNSRLTMLLEEALCSSRVLLLVHVSPFARDATDTAHSLNFASRVRAVDFGAQRLRQDQEDRARAAQIRSQQEARQLQQQLDQAKRDLADSQKVQSDLKQQVSHLGEQLRERQRELMREQELRSKAEDCAREYRIAGRSDFTTGTQGRPISPVSRSASAPRLWTQKSRPQSGPKAPSVETPRGTAPAKQRPQPALNRGFLDQEEPEVLDSVSPSKAQTGDLPPRKPFLDRTNETEIADVAATKMLLSPSKAEFTSPTKTVRDIGTPTRSSLLTPERLCNLSPCANAEVPSIGLAENKIKSPRKVLPCSAAQVRSVLKKLPTDFKSRLMKKQELGTAFATGGKHVTFAEQEQTACSPPRWYLDLLEYELSCKQAESKGDAMRTPPRGRSLTPPQRRRTEVSVDSGGPRWRH